MRCSTNPAKSGRSSSSAWCWSAEYLDGAAGHRRQDDDGVAVFDRGLEPLQDPDVLVVEVDVDVAVQLAVLAEELGRSVGELAGQRAQNLADVGAAGLDLGLAASFLAQHWGNANGRHRVGDPT